MTGRFRPKMAHVLPIATPAIGLFVSHASADHAPAHELCHRGVKEVVVVDASAEAMEVVSARNKHAGRTGLMCVVGDIASPQPPKLPNSELLYDFVIDKASNQDLCCAMTDQCSHCCLARGLATDAC